LRDRRFSDAVAQRTPVSLKRWVNKLMRRPIDVQRAVISPDFKRYLSLQLEPDVRQLRNYLGDDFDGWGIG